MKTWKVVSEVLELVPDKKENVQAAFSDSGLNSSAHIDNHPEINETSSSDTDDSNTDIMKKTVCLQVSSSSDSDTCSE